MKNNKPVKYSTGQAAKLIGYSVKTLQRWDDQGKLTAFRTKSNRRYYTDELIDPILKESEKIDRLIPPEVLNILPAGSNFVLTIAKDGFTGKVDLNSEDLKSFKNKLSKLD